jgi:hypothetical protein
MCAMLISMVAWLEAIEGKVESEEGSLETGQLHV